MSWYIAYIASMMTAVVDNQLILNHEKAISVQRIFKPEEIASSRDESNGRMTNAVETFNVA